MSFGVFCLFISAPHMQNMSLAEHVFCNVSTRFGVSSARKKDESYM